MTKKKEEFKIVTGADDGRTDLGKFRIGQKVEIINYGHVVWEFKEDLPPDKIRTRDLRPELVGVQGVISGKTVTQNMPKYKLSTERGSMAWFNEDQLKRI